MDPFLVGENPDFGDEVIFNEFEISDNFYVVTNIAGNAITVDRLISDDLDANSEVSEYIADMTGTFEAVDTVAVGPALIVTGKQHRS